jgi:hypothetical protein
MACKCATCKLSKKIQRLRPKWNKQTHEVVNELWDRMEWAETGECVMEAKMKGDWPSYEWTKLDKKLVKKQKLSIREVIVKVDGKVKNKYRFAEQGSATCTTPNTCP